MLLLWIIELDCRVEKVKNSYSLLCAPYDSCGEVRGFAVDGGFIDGYISSDHEGGFYGIIKPEGFCHPVALELEIKNEGEDMECAGVAFCLSFSEPRIKVIPRKYGDKPLSEGDMVRIRLNTET